MNNPTNQIPGINVADDERSGVSLSTGEQAIFWAAIVIWIAAITLVVNMDSILIALHAEFAFLLVYVVAVLVALVAVNFAALYPAVRKDLRSKTIITIGWILSIVFALLIDLGFLWGIARSIIFESTMY